ncbi:MAG: hypothetical protein GY847_35265 [Proteobacteria bacterium]|nr:hypothetical protein [Pseudomonadota bacterium]
MSEQIPKPEINKQQSKLERFAFPATVAVAIIFHILTVLYFAPPDIVLGKKPVANLYHELYVGQTLTVTNALDRSGESWAYDPTLLAGIPEGTSIDTNSRAWQLWTYSLWKMGVPKSKALNLFILLVHLLAPLVVFLSARLLNLGKWSALTAAGLAYLLWFFDGYLHWCWWSGMIAYAMTGYLVLLTLSLYIRYLCDPKIWIAVLMAIVIALTHLVHAYAVFALIIPMVVLYIGSIKKLTIGHHFSLLAVVGFAIAVNAYWIAPGLKFLNPGDGSTQVGIGTLSHLLTDFLGLTSDTNVSGGIGLRSGFRFLILGAAVITLVLWKKDRDERFHPITVALIWLIGLTYLGGYLPGLKSIQPYRHIVPALFLATIPAAQLIEEVRRRGALSNLPRTAHVVGLMIVLAALPRLVRDVVYFVPAFVTEPKDLPEETPHIADLIGFGSIGYPRHRDYRYRPTPGYFKQTVKWINKWDEESGRVLVEYEPLAEHLARKTKMHIIGGSRLRRASHTMSNLFTWYKGTDPSPDDLKKYLQTYAISWVITLSNPDLGDDEYREKFMELDNIIEPVGKVWPFQILKTKVPISYFKKGSGVVKASMNRIEVTETDPRDDIVLRFHWLSTLVCRNDCIIKREAIERDTIGFIHVPAPHPSDFIIENGY